VIGAEKVELAVRRLVPALAVAVTAPVLESVIALTTSHSLSIEPAGRTFDPPFG